MKTALYPGTFDPVTFGHLDIIARASLLFDRLIVAIAVNDDKKPMFSTDQRLLFLRDSLQSYSNVTVSTFSGLSVTYAREEGASVILRGLRSVSDFEEEFRMASMNRKLDQTIETVFLMTGDGTVSISSKLIKEIARHGGDVGPFVPPMVLSALRALGHG